ncbi:expressed hypothetical protein [Trichoplax adhaerens]|uniref:Large ribosomal subunit protein eL6 n=1 Tax=Trichoplax adhaerens TaxID=10228 RepID=B3RMU2_TRIAD|nr:expressed hypothetical protein [Trichoplax adhaerens]EDV27910.1 expressed hypothetical protein [Trichoplax adhaerens]|eukprot:XP_002109744.1 expressed hypothetical protein [Trichoplax adhaerens]
MGKPHQSRNKVLPGGAMLYSRSQMYRKRALYKRKKVGTKKVVQEIAKTIVKPVKGDKNGNQRVLPVQREPRYYPTEDTRRPLVNRKKQRPTKLRSSITPGTVLILLAGNHRGKRVVFLKQLASGLLLVTGPYKINGVPLRRVDQAYVIATKTKLDISGVKLPERLNDAYFKKPQVKRRKNQEMFEEEEKKTEASPEKKEDQAAVDSQVIAAVAKVDQMKPYLRAPFSLRKKQYPHAMAF